MLSKEQKMKYGELLRQQIKEKEEAKKAQKREHTPFQEPAVVPQPHVQPRVMQPPQPQEANIDRFKSDREAQKDLLAKKMEEQSYNPFGKFGSGAPNKQINNVQGRNRDHSIANREGEKMSRQQQYMQQEKFQMNQMGPQKMRMNMQMAPNPYTQDPMQAYRRIPTPEFLQGAYNNVPFVNPQYASPAPYGYVNVNENEINYVGKIDITPRPKASYEPKYEHLQLNQNFQPPYIPQQQPRFQRNEQYQQPPHQQMIDNNNQNMEEMQRDVFRKGGRNLLKLENQTPQQIMSKQNQKLRLQQQLKKQMEEVARRKKEEEQKMREEDEKLERKNKEFLQMDKRKYEEELNMKKGQAKNMEEANSNAGKNEPVNLKKEKFQKIRQEVARRQQEQSRQVELKEKEKQKQKQNAYLRNAQKNMNKKASNEMDEVASISNDTQMSRGFNTAISKQFFKKQREKSGIDKGKVDKITQQMEKMRKQIAHQGHFYHKELQKMQRQAQRAKTEKEKADEEIIRLQKQLRQKMNYHNKKYLGEGVYEGKVKMKDPYYADEVKLEQNANSLKPKKEERLVLKEFRPEDYTEYASQNNDIMRNDSEMMSLIGDSKKIPLEIDTNQSLSISKLDKFAVDTEYFKKDKKSQPMRPKKYHPQESILEEDEDERMEESRQSNRGRPKNKPQQELDMLIESRKKSRGGWGEMSSVNEDVVNEIESLLQKNQRPKSHLSKMGQKSLQSYEIQALNRPKNENPVRKSSSVSKRDEDEAGTMNSLDKLIQKYL